MSLALGGARSCLLKKRPKPTTAAAHAERNDAAAGSSSRARLARLSQSTWQSFEEAGGRRTEAIVIAADRSGRPSSAPVQPSA